MPLEGISFAENVGNILKLLTQWIHVIQNIVRTVCLH